MRFLWLKCVVLALFVSCNNQSKVKEVFIYQKNILNILNKNRKKGVLYNIYLKDNERKDTLKVNQKSLDEKLKFFFKYGLYQQDLTSYHCEEHEENNYNIVELTAKNTNQEVRSLFFKKNKEGDFYYMIKTVSKSRLGTIKNQMSFSSTGKFLILSEQKVSFSYLNSFRAEGRPISK